MPRRRTLLHQLGQRIADLRNEQELTQQHLAEHTDLSISTISRIESGLVPNPTLTTLHQLSKALGTTLSRLFEGL